MVDYLTRARTFYAGLDPARQTQLWLGLVAAIATIVGLSWWMTNEPYADLISGSADEVGRASAALADAGIPTRYDGLYLEVPEAQHGVALGVLHNAKVGVQSGKIDIPMGASPTVIRQKLLRQDELDLAADIANQPGVQSASVHIEPGVDTLFGEEVPSKASVFLQLHSGAPVGNEQVKAIQALVSGSVNGMSPDYVAVVDSNGNVLADGQGGGATGSANRELIAQQEAHRMRIEASVEKAIRPFVGFGYTMSVAAAVEVDPVTRAETETTYDVDKVFERKTRFDERKKEKTSGAEGGPPGVDSGLPERSDAPASSGGTNSEESTKAEVLNDAPRKDTHTRQSAGQLTRAAVTVSLDETRLAALWGTEVGSDLWKARLAELEKAGRHAMGFFEERGDSFSMSVLPFVVPETVEAPSVTVTGATAAVAPFVPYAIAFVALLLAFIFVVRPLMAKVSAAPLRGGFDMEIGPDGVPRRIGGGGAMSEDDLAGRLHRLVEDFQPVDSNDLNTLVDQQADASAQVLRQWARDEG